MSLEYGLIAAFLLLVVVPFFIVESSWSRSPRLSRVKSIFPCRPCMAIAWADISAVMSPRQYLGMAVRSEETSTIQPDSRSASTRRTISAIFGVS